MDRGLVTRLEHVEVLTVERLVEALAATGVVDPVPTAVVFGRGLLVVTGDGRYLNRAVGITLEDLTEHDVAGVVAHYDAAGLRPAVQLSSWAPEVTVLSLGRAGFVPTSCRSVFASSALAGGPALRRPSRSFRLLRSSTPRSRATSWPVRRPRSVRHCG